MYFENWALFHLLSVCSVCVCVCFARCTSHLIHTRFIYVMHESDEKRKKIQIKKLSLLLSFYFHVILLNRNFFFVYIFFCIFFVFFFCIFIQNFFLYNFFFVFLWKFKRPVSQNKEPFWTGKKKISVQKGSLFCDTGRLKFQAFAWGGI